MRIGKTQCLCVCCVELGEIEPGAHFCVHHLIERKASAARRAIHTTQKHDEDEVPCPPCPPCKKEAASLGFLLAFGVLVCCARCGRRLGLVMHVSAVGIPGPLGSSSQGLCHWMLGPSTVLFAGSISVMSYFVS